MRASAVCAYILMMLLVLSSVCQAENGVPNRREISLENFLRMDNGERSYSDIATVNLLCAKGLPGAEDIDVQQHLSTLEEWAKRVESETARLFPLFYDNPKEYSYSEGYFRTLVLVTVLSLDLGVGYNPALISDPSMDDLKSTDFFRNSEDIFIHGIIEGKPGTCTSIPVLTVAVGRMLGYPLRLVNAKAHLFARWEGESERFNVENTGHGLNSHTDEHYMKWPFKITADELATGYFLQSLSPAEEMATFLEIRAACLLENKQFAKARKFFQYAYSLYPNHPYLKGYIESLAEK